jgi:hypothetical protein
MMARMPEVEMKARKYDVLQALLENPGVSMNSICRDFRMSKRTVYELRKEPLMVLINPPSADSEKKPRKLL